MTHAIRTLFVVLFFCGICTFAETAYAVPVSLEFSWNGAFNVFGHMPLPQVNGFDYAITTEAVESRLAGQDFTLSSIRLTADAISTGNRVNFDVEIHLNGTSIGLPSGQYYSTHVDPVAGYTRHRKRSIPPRGR